MQGFTRNIAADIVEQIQLYGSYYGRQGFIYDMLGRRSSFTSTSAFNDVKEFDSGVALNPILNNSSLDIISSNAADTNAAGTGVRKVKVTYINNSNLLVQSPDINLNGTTLVTNVLTGVNEVLWMEAVDVGSGVIAAGNIRLRINGGTVEVEQITAQQTRSLSARFMIPLGYNGYLVDWSVGNISNAQDFRIRATANMFDKTVLSHFNTVSSLNSPSNSYQPNISLNLMCFSPLTKIKISTISSSNAAATRADAGFTIAILEN